jgi:hypothetical protein
VALLASEHGASVVTHDDEHYAPIEGADGVFDLPDHVAAALLPFEGWRMAEAHELPDVEPDPADDDSDDPDDDESEDESDVEPDPAAAPAKPRRNRARSKTS